VGRVDGSVDWGIDGRINATLGLWWCIDSRVCGRVRAGVDICEAGAQAARPHLVTVVVAAALVTRRAFVRGLRAREHAERLVRAEAAGQCEHRQDRQKSSHQKLHPRLIAAPSGVAIAPRRILRESALAPK